MTTINASQLPLDTLQQTIVQGIVKGNGTLRASKPGTPKKINTDGYNYDYATQEDAIKGISAYVWRMVSFQVSDDPKLQCMPVMAFCDLPSNWHGMNRKEIEKWADEITKVVVDSIPPTEWYGVRRWGQAIYG